MALIEIGGGFVDPEYVAAILPNEDGSVNIVFNSGAHFPVTLQGGTTITELAEAFNAANAPSDPPPPPEGEEWKYE